ncbi:hypothetical protein VCHA54P500_190021 [Vibrio chagasii]|nr:hypothetical protein VCHA34P117_200077 [Vibrio chagasii]CAH6993654.1 hypothetical protein VCHA48P439_190022 [Vibrio chagasii]CAH7008943.1 hypothetical protein VCHA40O236_190077 [Vibrio chagasii]CAH7056370.1 hypothetical protein VCHA54P500_190021 [Vibrio chagasii]CAH7244211.1 hypothetical protein VCHA53O462_190022 [Vibrio chagasii]
MKNTFKGTHRVPFFIGIEMLLKVPFWGLFVLGKGAENSMSFLFLELKLFD